MGGVLAGGLNIPFVLLLIGILTNDVVVVEGVFGVFGVFVLDGG